VGRIQNGPCRICKNICREFKWWRGIQNSLCGMKQQCEGELKMLHAEFEKSPLEFKQQGGIENSPYGMK
jgi:hypothetical protein